jgi:hypothetical protein
MPPYSLLPDYSVGIPQAPLFNSNSGGINFKENEAPQLDFATICILIIPSRNIRMARINDLLRLIAPAVFCAIDSVSLSLAGSAPSTFVLYLLECRALYENNPVELGHDLICGTMQPDVWEKMEYDEFLGRRRILIAGVIRCMAGEAVWLGRLFDVAPICALGYTFNPRRLFYKLIVFVNVPLGDFSDGVIIQSNEPSLISKKKHIFFDTATFENGNNKIHLSLKT